MWAAPVAGSESGLEFRLENSPFFAKGVSNQDIVRGKAIVPDAHYKFDGIVNRSGRSTYRIIGNPDDAPFKSFWARLAAMGCTYERGMVRDRWLYAVDVPQSADIDSVYAVLEEGEKEGAWVFEEGHVGHEAKSG